jgi:hypothetical protein
VARHDSQRKRERGQGSDIDQAEHNDREAERPYAGRTIRGATDDRDPDDVGAPARESQSNDRRGSGGGRERTRPRALVRHEEPTPRADLEGVGDEEEKPRGREEAGIPSRERQRCIGEATRSQDRQGNCESP